MIFKISIFGIIRLIKSCDTCHYPRAFQGGEKIFSHQLTEFFKLIGIPNCLEQN